MSSKRKERVVKISIFITSVLVIFFSISYAFINQTLTGTKRQVITSGKLELDFLEGEVVTLENALPIYDEVGMIQKPFDFTLHNKMDDDIIYTLYLKDVTTSTEKLDTGLIRYGLTKDERITKDFLSNLVDNALDTGNIKGNQTIHYSLRLWVDYNVEDENLIKDKSLSYKIEVKATLADTKSYASNKIFESDNLGDNCKTYDDGVDTFLVGQCSKNYVWYSGKLWRIVLKNNETGLVKMVTDNAITSIAYNALNNTAFENSYMDQWLNQEFLPTLHDYEDYLVVSSSWNVALNSSDMSSRPMGIKTAQRTVGLLNAYEYYTTYNKSDGLATYNTGYLNNDTYWWLMTPYGASNVQKVDYSGYLNYIYPNANYGARPSVNMKSDIRITSGNGTQSKPYMLERDSGQVINGTTLLSTRYSGEYITFNNGLYRIVGVEGSKTKITAVNKPVTLSSNSFHSENGVGNFANASIKTDLEAYYQNDIVEPYKFMVEPNQTWYLGTVGEVSNNYKASICKTVDIKLSASSCERTDATTTASVGLPRAGEMFASQIARGTKVFSWTLTPYSTVEVRFVDRTGDLDHKTLSAGYGARPSMYLKSNVVISKDNTGDGTYEHPYDIELGE